MEKNLKTYESDYDECLKFKIDRDFLIQEPQPLWDKLSFGFGPRIMKFLTVPGLSFDDLYQLGGHLRHRRISGQFY